MSWPKSLLPCSLVRSRAPRWYICIHDNTSGARSAFWRQETMTVKKHGHTQTCCLECGEVSQYLVAQLHILYCIQSPTTRFTIGQPTRNAKTNSGEVLKHGVWCSWCSLASGVACVGRWCLLRTGRQPSAVSRLRPLRITHSAVRLTRQFAPWSGPRQLPTAIQVHDMPAKA
ncbi:hypothetical protein BDV95DRAFT_278126 [Massariosphaeria phaeospora]|uniref:Uncharacterized protein n=1 Tax=Massariosphaeria phaeospora TaxID=100035 RepID=A0A7C8IBK6_9PLEO|nr:hypothetical protein BDV95DRAFT_278126 [Massariosphaeria phaeospora]